MPWGINKRTGKIYGTQIAARGAEVVFDKVDAVLPPLIGTGASPHERWSTWLNIAGGILLPLVGDSMKVSDETKMLTEVAGGHMFSNVVDYSLEYLGMTGFSVGGAAPSAVPSQQVNQAVAQKPSQMGAPKTPEIVGVGLRAPKNGSRYAIQV